MSEEPIEMRREEAMPERTISGVIKSQFLSKSFLDVMSSSEFRENEIISMSNMFLVRTISLILGTTEKDLEGLTGEQLAQVRERLWLKQKMLENPNAMAGEIIDAWNFMLALSRQSLKRASRHEGVSVASGPKMLTAEKDVGKLGALAARMGLSRKHEVVYVEK